MYQKCEKCGRWCIAPYEKSPYKIGRFIDSLLGYEGGACFRCECGNEWVELDKTKDQVSKFRKEKSPKISTIASKGNSGDGIFGEESKHVAKHAAMHILKGLLGGG